MYKLELLTSQFSHFADGDLEKTISDLSITAVVAGAVALVLLVGLAVFMNKRWPGFKPILFSLIVIITLGTTFTISGGTIYLNLNSATGGPVHWHTDFEIWACNNELELRDPHGALSNKIGTPTLHEHNDKRIHLEGVPVELPHDASLGKFMNVVGGEIADSSLVIPLNDDKYFEGHHEEVDGDGSATPAPEDVQPYILTGKDGKYAKFVNGDTCGEQPAEVQVFVYRYNQQDKTYKQTKIDHPANYELSHHSDVPPSDCVIIEFAPQKDHTNKLCRQYGVRDSNLCESFGVKPEDHDVCVIKEVR